jgi:hypothetical protein
MAYNDRDRQRSGLTGPIMALVAIVAILFVGAFLYSMSTGDKTASSSGTTATAPATTGTAPATNTNR